MRNPDPVTGADLMAYVDGELDLRRRYEVEEYLAAHPNAAADVLADLRDVSALRLTAGVVGEASPAQRRAMQRLTRALPSGRRRALLAAGGMGAAAAAVVALVVWTGAPARQPLSQELVAEAAMAHRAALTRAAMASQPESPLYDSQEIRSATHIVLPELPEGWRITDVQVFPSDLGLSVQMVFETADLGTISLFAARTLEPGDVPPTLRSLDRGSVVYFRVGRLAYALTGADKPDRLKTAAAALASNLPASG